MEKESVINIEVVYATPENACLLALKVDRGTTVREAIQTSGILLRFPAIDLNNNAVGIFSRRVPLTTILKEGDRIEIYRPLSIDPIDARRKRVKLERKKALSSRGT